MVALILHHHYGTLVLTVIGNVRRVVGVLKNGISFALIVGMCLIMKIPYAVDNLLSHRLECLVQRQRFTSRAIRPPILLARRLGVARFMRSMNSERAVGDRFI